MTEKIRLQIDGKSKSAEKSLDNVSDKTEELTKSFGGAAKAAGLMAAAITAVGVGYALKTAAEFETLRASLKTVTGSVENAEKAFNLIKEFAATTPFQLQEVTDAFIKMKAFGLDASSEALRAYGNTAAAMGKSLNQMIEAVADAATGEFERLKEFGIKSSSQGDQVTFTFKGITKTVKKNSKEIVGYLKDIGNEDFAGAMADQMDTLNGKFSNFNDALAQAADAFAGKSGLTEAAKGFLDVASDGLKGFITLISSIDEISVDQLESRFNQTTTVLLTNMDRLREAQESLWIPEAGFEAALAKTQAEFDILVAEFQRRTGEAKADAAEATAIGGAADPLATFVANEMANEAERAQKGEHLSALNMMEADYYAALSRQSAEAREQRASDIATVNDFEVKTTEQKTKFVLQSMLETTAGVSKSSKTMFKINKALALANAVATLPDAVLQSYRNAGGYPWGVIPATLMAAAGAVQIASIKKSSFGGGGGAPSAPTGGGAIPSPQIPLPTGPLLAGQIAEDTPAAPLKQALILRVGTGKFSEEDGVNMLEMFQKIGGDGYEFILEV